MILTVNNPEVFHGSEPIRRIDMSKMDSDSIQFMLENSRDGFYSNKELAPIREYSTNAMDAHIVAGIPNRPIEITLPSQLHPELRIRDFGKGLTIDELTDIYFKYWKSTKRNTNALNGALGIGCKSFFAYSDVFTVISICNGFKTVCTGQRNGFADVIYHQPNTNNEPDGIEVVAPIQQKDISKFILEAKEFFKYWDVKPIFHNIDAAEMEAAFAPANANTFLTGNGWSVRPAGGYGRGESKAVMGYVPYNIDWNQVRNSIAPALYNKISGIFDFLRENITTFYFDNGTLSFTPNREFLQYNDFTVKALSDKLLEIYKNLLKLISDKISDAPTIWEAKIRYNHIFRKEFDDIDHSFSYSGNLSVLENLLKDRIEWNGTVISNGMFENLDRWDSVSGRIIPHTILVNGNVPVMTVYVKDENGTNVKKIGSGSRRRYSYSTSAKSIIASPKSVVIIQDTEKSSLAKGFARWYLCKSGKTFPKFMF